MNRLIISCLCLVMLCSSSGWAGSPSDSDTLVKLERVDHLSAKEFWAIGAPNVIRSRGLPIIGYWPFDPDEIREDEERRLIGIIGAGLTDVGVTPVLAKVWARSGATILLEESQTISKERLTEAVAILGLASIDCPPQNVDRCENMKLRFSVREDGSVFVDEMKFGIVQ